MGTFQSNLKTDHQLFTRLVHDSPECWRNLKNDPDIYIDVRKDNYLNVYYNGGAIMKLEGTKDYKAKIHFEYIPLQTDENYIGFQADCENISLQEIQVIKIDNFSKKVLNKIKKRIRNFYPNDSEKGIQAHFVTMNRKSTKASGFFIDTEFQFPHSSQDSDLKGRIDLIWIDLERKQMAFVELKTTSDSRLFGYNSYEPESIDIQLKKYQEFAQKNREELISHFQKVFIIKKQLGILPSFISIDSLEGFTLLEKPVLLIGNCKQKWINDNSELINSRLKDIAFGCIYQGETSFNFALPTKTSRNSFFYG